MMAPTPAFRPGRRRRHVHRPVWRLGSAVILAALLLVVGLVPSGRAFAQRRWVVAFANATEQPGVTLEGTGFTGAEVHGSFDLAVRQYPIDLVFYDNQRDDARAVANAEAAIARKVDLYIQYHRGSGGQRHGRAEAEGRRHSRAGGLSRGARRAALQCRQRGGRPSGRRGVGRVRHAVLGRTADGRGDHRPRVRRRRPRTGAGPGSDRGAAQAVTGRPAHHARHAGESCPGRNPAGRLSREPALAEGLDRRHRRRHRAGGQVRGRGGGTAARQRRSSATASIAAFTVAPTIARRSTRATGPASSSGRSRSISTGWATTCSRSPSACSGASRSRR